MPGHRPREAITTCEVENSAGLRCKTHLNSGWTRCPYHTWQGAEQFARELAAGADIPSQLARHELLGIGLYYVRELAAGRIARAALSSGANQDPYEPQGATE